MDADIPAGRARWQARYDAARKRDADFTTLSGVELAPVYGPPGPVEGFERIGWPGEFPFTRGLYPTGYRGRPWTIRQFAGFGRCARAASCSTLTVYPCPLSSAVIRARRLSIL